MPRARVLFIDDDESVCNALRRSLRRSDYELLFANGPAQAIELLRKEPVDIIVSDHVMPGMSGLDLLNLCRDRCPDAVRIMLTGHADTGIAVAAINQGEIYRFLTKPWDDAELQVTLHLAWEKLQLERENRRLLAALRSHEELLARLEKDHPDISRALADDDTQKPHRPPSAH